MQTTARFVPEAPVPLGTCSGRRNALFNGACGAGEAGLVREDGELGDGGDLELAHEARAVALHGALIDTELGGDLLVDPAAEHVHEHLAVARGEAVEALLQPAPTR